MPRRALRLACRRPVPELVAARSGQRRARSGARLRGGRRGRGARAARARRARRTARRGARALLGDARSHRQPRARRRLGGTAPALAPRPRARRGRRRARRARRARRPLLHAVERRLAVRLPDALPRRSPRHLRRRADDGRRRRARSCRCGRRARRAAELVAQQAGRDPPARARAPPRQPRRYRRRRHAVPHDHASPTRSSPWRTSCCRQKPEEA